MTPPRLRLGSNETRSHPSSDSSSISPTLQAYSEKVRIARRPSWTPELSPSRISMKPSLQARPSGLVSLTSSYSPTTDLRPLIHSPGSVSPSIVVVDIAKRGFDFSPSYPFPRMNRKLRPQPLSAFSTDTIIRSHCPSLASADAQSIATADDRELEEAEDETSRDRVGTPSCGRPNWRRRRRLSSWTSESARIEPKIYLRASDDGASPFAAEAVISPLSLDPRPREPLSPLSPFGNLALFDALSPLPTPRFEIGDSESVDLSALVLEKYESEGGFPWVEVDEDAKAQESEVWKDPVGSPSGRLEWKASGLDTPPTSNPSSPSSRDPKRSCPSSSLSTSPPALSSPSSRVKNRLRRSTVTLASIFTTRSKPVLTRGRSASLPATPTQPNSSSVSQSSNERCKFIKRSLSLGRRKSRRPSQVQKQSISPPLPRPVDVVLSGRQAFEAPRTPPFSEWRFPSTLTSMRSLADPSLSPSLPSTASTTASTCISCSDLLVQLKQVQERSLALKGEVARLQKVVQVLISPSPTSSLQL